MAITEKKQIPWNPDLQALKQKLHVPASDAPLFEKAYAQAMKRFSPCVYYQAAQLEAIGDAFVLLSGVFIEEEQLVRALGGAENIWAFAVKGVEANEDMEWLLTLSQTAVLHSTDAWIHDLWMQTGQRYRLFFFPQTKEWMDLFSLPPDQASGVGGVAYVAPGCGSCQCGQKCAKGCGACVQ